jgi:uncharacterized membrane protein
VSPRGIKLGSLIEYPAWMFPTVVAIPAVVACGWFNWTMWQRADALQLPAYDSAFFEQVVWNLGRGRGFSSGFFNSSFLGLHFSPLLAIPALLELLWPDARLLMVLNVIALASAGPAAYLFLRALLEGARIGSRIWPAQAIHLDPRGVRCSLPHLQCTRSAAPSRRPSWTTRTHPKKQASWGPRGTTQLSSPYSRTFLGNPVIAAALAAPLPLWVAIQNAAGAGFHPEALALPMLFLAGWAGLRSRWSICWVCAVVALCAQENQAYSVAVIGLLILIGTSRRNGLALILVAILWTATAELVIMPGLRGSITSDLATYYDWLRHPTVAAIGAAIARPGGWMALAIMVAGMAGLPLLRPAWLALALPPLIGDLLSAHQPQPDLQLHYGLPLVLPVLVAGGLGARQLFDRHLSLEHRSSKEEDPSRYLTGSLAAGAVLAIPGLLLGATLGSLLGQRVAPAPAGLPQLIACTALLPARAPVATDDGVAAPLAARPVERPLTWVRSTDWVVVDRQDTQPTYVNVAARAGHIATLQSEGRHRLCDDGRFQLWGPAIRPSPFLTRNTPIDR